jgi:tetratricopeptide (TPR) repeat protein
MVRTLLCMFVLSSVGYADSTLPGPAVGEAVVARCTDVSASEEPLYAEGLRAYRDKKLPEARRSWVTLVKEKPLSPFLPDVFLHFGDYYFEQGDLKAALQFYDKVLQYPKVRCIPSVNLQRGHAFFNQASYEEAMMAFVRAIQETRDPSISLRARRGLVLSYAKVGHPAKARAFFTRIAPDHVDEMLGWLSVERAK